MVHALAYGLAAYPIIVGLPASGHDLNGGGRVSCKVVKLLGEGGRREATGGAPQIPATQDVSLQATESVRRLAQKAEAATATLTLAQAENL